MIRVQKEDVYWQWRKPGVEFGGRKIISRTKIFFRKKFPFSRTKFLTTFFLIIDQVFRIFPFFSRIFCIFTMLNVVYDPFLTRETTISERNSFMTLFSLSSYFRAHPTLLLKILGRDGCMGRLPTSNFGGTVPPGLPPSVLASWPRITEAANR